MTLCHYGTTTPGVPVGTIGYQWIPVVTSGYQWVPVGISAVGTSGYQEYQEDQHQISGATYIFDVVFITSFFKRPSSIWNSIPKYPKKSKKSSLLFPGSPRRACHHNGTMQVREGCRKKMQQKYGLLPNQGGGLRG